MRRTSSTYFLMFRHPFPFEENILSVSLRDDPLRFIASIFFLQFLFFMHGTLVFLKSNEIPETNSAIFLDVITQVAGIIFCCRI